jgi:SAM-dependent methyltransferase
MYTDIIDLREFYQSSLGRTVRHVLRERLRRIWPNLQGEHILTLGYGIPLMRPMMAEAGSLVAMMPATQGVAYWPHDDANVTCLIDIDALPLPDASVDRIILLHALEGASEPHGMLREIWRVLKNSGHLLLIVPNRRGLWAHSDRTPFGTGRPYSAFQLKDTLRDYGFLTERMWHALYVPPTSSRVMLSGADLFEKYGEKIFPGLGGLIIAEASKQMYVPLLTKSKNAHSRLILPFPMPNPFPAG